MTLDVYGDIKKASDVISQINKNGINKQIKILMVSSIHHPDIGVVKKSIEGDKQRKVTQEILKNKRIQINDYNLIIVYQPNSGFKSFFKELKSSKIPYFLITGPKTDWTFLNKENLGLKKNILNL